MKKALIFGTLLFCLGFFPGLGAEESFGFGFDGEEEGDSPGLSLPLSVKIGGGVTAELGAFVRDFNSREKLENTTLGNIFSGDLDFSVSGSAAEAVIKLDLKADFQNLRAVVSFDEAYVRAFFGPVDIEGGLRKLSWGRADSFGPLDVINPLDYSDLTKIANPQDLKISRPMLHVSWRAGDFSKLEGVFLPGFQGQRFDLQGRWAPAQITGLPDKLTSSISSILAGMPPALAMVAAQNLLQFIDSFDPQALINQHYWENSSALKFFQGGLRFSTTLGSSDLGLQYYYGRLHRPALGVGFEGFINTATGDVDPGRLGVWFDYNPYHQIGIDFARVVAGFNIRAELAANITNDFGGDRGDVYNPSVAWSLGFDRDLFLGINLNLQTNETIRLFHDKIGANPFVHDTEDGKQTTSTRITAILSRKFLRDELEIRLAGLWGIEDKDYSFLPGLIWAKNDLSVELRGGFFGGDKEGELGQYRDNHFVKALIKYNF